MVSLIMSRGQSQPRRLIIKGPEIVSNSNQKLPLIGNFSKKPRLILVGAKFFCGGMLLKVGLPCFYGLMRPIISEVTSSGQIVAGGCGVSVFGIRPQRAFAPLSFSFNTTQPRRMGVAEEKEDSCSD